MNRACENNPNLAKAWLEGSWDFTAGGAIDDLWRKEVHIIPRFKVPSGWYIDRAFDWGSSEPFSVGWWAEANGEEVEMPDGSIFCPTRGSLIQIAEWYGTEKIGTNRGLKLSASDISEGIIEIEINLMEGGWISTQPNPGPADNQISEDRRTNQDTIEKEMSDKGVLWTKSNKSKGTRINGLQLIRDRLQSSLKKEGPGIYFMQNCQSSIKTLPSLPRDPKEPDDVDTKSEDHVYDMTRYRVLAGNNRIITGGSYY